MCPPVWPTTFTAKVHEPPAAMVPPERLTVETPATVPVVMVPAPQEPVSPLGLATTSPEGRLSEKATPVRATVALGLVMVKVSVVVAFRLMLAAPKALAIAGGPITVIVAVLLVRPAPLSFDETGPLVLFCTPAATPVTFRPMVHEALAASVPPERLMDPEPAAAVVVPPQVLESPFGVATFRPAGSRSVKAIPVSPRVVFGLVIVKVNEVLAFKRMLVAPKAFVMVGALATVRLAVAVFPVPPLVDVTAPVVLV